MTKLKEEAKHKFILLHCKRNVKQNSAFFVILEVLKVTFKKVFIKVFMYFPQTINIVEHVVCIFHSTKWRQLNLQ